MHVAYIYKCQSTERHDTCKNYRSGVENILFLTTKTIGNILYFILYSENQCISKLDKNGIFIDVKFH